MAIVTKNYEPVKPRELDFSEETIPQRLTELVKTTKVTEVDFWDGINTYVLQTVKKIIEGCLEEEVKFMIQADWYEHTPLREGKRSGYYTRGLITKYGLIEGLLVPKLRKKKYKEGFKVLKRYVR
ncbi:MAG: transposase, partial [Endomicrobiia bacterium]